MPDWLYYTHPQPPVTIDPGVWHGPAWNVDTCEHCGQWHPGECPRIKRIKYHPDGTIKMVEYHDHA